MCLHTRSSPTRQQNSVPTPSLDGPHPDELRARRVLNRVRISDALARELAGLAFAIPEKLERRA